MCTFSLRFFCILQICQGSVTDNRTDGQTEGQSPLEDASRIKYFEMLSVINFQSVIISQG